MSIHVLGIRHHGPGSARNVKAFLEQQQPDIILVEGPPEGDELLRWSAHSDLKPPVAILAYRPDKPQRAVFYPFAEFSPEWQAIAYGARNNVTVRFMDLPLAHSFAIEDEKAAETQNPDTGDAPAIDHDVYTDPLTHFAQAAGFDDGERWWEYMFEHRRGQEGIFAAVHETMHTLRSELPEKDDRIEKLREAHMRKVIRQAEKDGYQRITVICGAWHEPVLTEMPKQKDDNELLKGLPRIKVETTWIPWTYNRLTFASGYGAGIQSPGWYHHVWNHPADDGTLWMARVAQLFRSHDIDTSVAHSIEAVRLAETLAALRGLSKTGLQELTEATRAVMCNGDDILLYLIRDAMIVSDRLGVVPAEVTKPPLVQDVEKTQKRLRLPVETSVKEITLDLREPGQLERSVFLHRLLLIDITWAHTVHAKSKGTFKEQWQLKWEPEYVLQIIEKGTWGNTLEEAAANYVAHQARDSQDLPTVSILLEKVIPADLSQAVQTLIGQINNLAAATGDVLQLLQALPPLVSISRYGNVRQTDETLVLGIVNSMIARVCVSLPAACSGIDEDSAASMTSHIYQMNEAVLLLNQPEQKTTWYASLENISGNSSAAPIVAGYTTRVLSDGKMLEGEALENRFYFALSRAATTADAAAWLEGFLKGSGTILIIDNRLWQLVDQWVRSLNEPDFVANLPLMRRTFAQFTNAERRKIGEKVKQADGESGNVITRPADNTIDTARGLNAMPIIATLLGIAPKNPNDEPHGHG